MIKSVITGDMDENFAIKPAENKPRIAFVRNVSINFKRNIALLKRVLHAIKLGQFIIRPVTNSLYSRDYRINDRH